jgi:hypothetical protein
MDSLLAGFGGIPEATSSEASQNQWPPSLSLISDFFLEVEDSSRFWRQRGSTSMQDARGPHGVVIGLPAAGADHYRSP